MNNTFRKNIEIVLLFILPAVCAILLCSFPSLSLKYLSAGHDIYYHIQAIKGQTDGIERGVFPLYINALANNGAGDCRYIVYPYLFTYIPAYIYGITRDICVSINIFIIIINICTFIIMYISTKTIYKDKMIAFFASIFYLLCFYRIFNIYDRQAMGEYIALVFTPLIISGFYNIFFDDKKKWYYLTIGITCVIQSHIITSFYFIVFVIVASILMIRRMLQDKDILRYYIYAGVLTILINLWYLIPFIQYYIEQKIYVTTFGGYVEGFNAFIDNFIIDYRVNNRYYNCLGLESIVAMIFTPVILFFISYIAKNKKSESSSFDKKTYIVSIVFLLIFYYYFIASIGLLDNKITDVLYAKQQYLYRELGRGLPFLAMAFSYAISKIKVKGMSKIIFIYALICICAYTSFTYISTKNDMTRYDTPANATLPDYLFYNSEEIDKVRMPLSEKDFADNIKYKASISEIYKEMTYDMYDDNTSNVDIVNVKKGYLSYMVEYANASSGGYVEVPLCAFTGYVAKDENDDALMIERGDNNYIKVYVKENSGIVKVKFDPPIWWKVANIISLITVLLIFVSRVRYEISEIRKVWK